MVGHVCCRGPGGSGARYPSDDSAKERTPRRRHAAAARQPRVKIRRTATIAAATALSSDGRRRTRPPAEAGPSVGPAVVVAGRLGRRSGMPPPPTSLTTIRTPRSPWSTTRDTPYPTSNRISCAASSRSGLRASSARADPDQARPGQHGYPAGAKGGMQGEHRRRRQGRFLYVATPPHPPSAGAVMPCGREEASGRGHRGSSGTRRAAGPRCTPAAGWRRSARLGNGECP
jgi:hypothetical protein